MYRSLSTCNQVLTEMNKKMKKGFTLIEMAVAIGLLAMIIIFATVVFRVSIDAYRVAIANTEIMQKVRAITDQLNSDFGGIRREIKYPVAISFNFDDNNDLRADRVAFIASGDFQSTGQYGIPERTIVGNVASISYSQAADPDPNSDDPEDKRKKILARRQTILTSDANSSLVSDSNEYGEYYLSSLAEWDVNSPFYTSDMSDTDEFVSNWTQRPDITLSDPNDLVMYMAKGVDDFTIQLEKGFDANDAITWWPTNPEVAGGGSYTGFPKAIKFTFTLYDSKGIIKNGKTFTHIVYIGD